MHDNSRAIELTNYLKRFFPADVLDDSQECCWAFFDDARGELITRFLDLNSLDKDIYNLFWVAVKKCHKQVTNANKNPTPVLISLIEKLQTFEN